MRIAILGAGAIGGFLGARLARLIDNAESAGENSAERALLLDAMIASIAYRSIVRAVDPETPFKVDELAAAGVIAPDTAGLFAYLLQVLVRFGAATELPLDGQALPGHFVAGAYNCLADARRLGWHPSYQTLFPEE